MTNEEQLANLRALFRAAPESTSTQVLGIVLSLVLVTTVLWLVKRRSLRAEYTPIWLAVAIAAFCVSVSDSLMKLIMNAVGAWTASSALFFLGQLFLVTICLNYAVRLSRVSLEVKNLHQELAILRSDVGANRAPPGSV